MLDIRLHTKGLNADTSEKTTIGTCTTKTIKHSNLPNTDKVLINLF